MVIVFGLVLAVIEVSKSANADPESWQMAQLFNPTDTQLEAESRGRVMIYHGFRDVVISRALDQQFDRVETMMFTGTILTDEEGRPRYDPLTGEVVVEDDGC
jgi:hypothetical protein